MVRLTQRELSFFKGRKGDVISKINGKVVLINKNYKGQRPKEGEKWICRIDFEKSKFIVVTPIEKIIKVQYAHVQEFKCGHREIAWIIEEKELPESEIRGNIIQKNDSVVVIEKEVARVSMLCHQCRKDCKHESTKIFVDFWNHGVTIRKRCFDCNEEWELYNFYDEEIDNKGFSALPINIIEQKLQKFKEQIREPEIKELFEKRSEEFIEFQREYKEMCRKEKELEQRLTEIIDEIIRLAGASKTEDIIIYRDEESGEVVVKAWFGKTAAVPTKCLGIGIGRKCYEYEDFEVYEKVEMTPEIRKLAEEYLKLKEELQRVKDWLVENRPIE